MLVRISQLRSYEHLANSMFVTRKLRTICVYAHIRIFVSAYIRIFAYSYIRVFVSAYIRIFAFSYIRIFEYSNIRTSHIVYNIRYTIPFVYCLQSTKRFERRYISLRFSFKMRVHFVFTTYNKSSNQKTNDLMLLRMSLKRVLNKEF